MQLQAVLNMVDNYVEDGGYVCIPGFKYVFQEYFDACRPNGNLDEIASYNFKEKDPVMKYAKVRSNMKFPNFDVDLAD